MEIQKIKVPYGLMRNTICEILEIVASFIILRNLVSAGLTFVWVLGIYGLIAGTMRIAAALSLKQTSNELDDLVKQKPVASSK